MSSGPRLFLIAGEASGDALGELLMKALRAVRPGAAFQGVGGAAMAREGLVSLFPLSDISVMGLLPVLARLPRLLRRIEDTARAVAAVRPDCLVLIDAPDFTHRVARRVRRALPELPIVDYVSPTVWAWRPGRARAMRAYVDCVLAILPFEPHAYTRLGGPPCVYVGHPLIEQLGELSRIEGSGDAPTLLVLPGSRLAEIARMTPLYGEALEALLRRGARFETAVPVVPAVEAALLRRLADWPLRPRLLSQAEKFPAFARAHAALVTSGAATLELAIAGVPLAVAYKVSALEWPLRRLVTVDSIVLPNLILGENAVPEFLQNAATPQALADALAPLLEDGAARRAQTAALAKVRARILEAGAHPSARAAAIVLDCAERGRRRDA